MNKGSRQVKLPRLLPLWFFEHPTRIKTIYLSYDLLCQFILYNHQSSLTRFIHPYYFAGCEAIYYLYSNKLIDPLKKTLCIVLAFLVSFLATGLNIGKMECMVSGEVSYTYGIVKGCCSAPEDDQDVLTENSCCIIQNTFLHLSSFNQNGGQILPKSNFCYLVCAVSLPASTDYLKLKSIKYFTTPDPPLSNSYGKTFITFSHTWII